MRLKPKEKNVMFFNFMIRNINNTDVKYELDFNLASLSGSGGTPLTNKYEFNYSLTDINKYFLKFKINLAKIEDFLHLPTMPSKMFQVLTT